MNAFSRAPNDKVVAIVLCGGNLYHMYFIEKHGVMWPISHNRRKKSMHLNFDIIGLEI